VTPISPRYSMEARGLLSGGESGLVVGQIVRLSRGNPPFWPLPPGGERMGGEGVKYVFYRGHNPFPTSQHPSPQPLSPRGARGKENPLTRTLSPRGARRLLSVGERATALPALLPHGRGLPFFSALSPGERVSVRGSSFCLRPFPFTAPCSFDRFRVAPTARQRPAAKICQGSRGLGIFATNLEARAISSILSFRHKQTYLRV